MMVSIERELSIERDNDGKYRAGVTKKRWAITVPATNKVTIINLGCSVARHREMIRSTAND